MNQSLRTQPRNIYVRRAAVVTACLAIMAVLVTGYWASELRLPAPATADREGLIRWLVLRDLRGETLEIRTTLLGRLQKEAEGDFDPATVRTQLDPGYHDRLWANILVLIETWYSARVDRYLATPAAERAGSLDQTIAEMKDWKDLAALQPNQNSAQAAAPSETELLKLLGQQVAIWKESASPQRRREIAEFDTALRGRWVLHALGLAPDTRP